MAAAGTYGLLAEFDTAQALLDATEKVTAAGYTKTDAFSPFPIHGLFDALRIKEHKVQPIILIGGLLGLTAGASLEYYTMVVWYPMNIAGRPVWAWVAYIPPAFETTILFAAFSAVIGMFLLNGLPRPYHPVFNAKRFAEHASSDSFFLVIEASDPKFDASRTRAFLSGLGPREVVNVDE
ncbi:MAG TPA: DUF3341 domain-containing protein [Vicinamibacterales bacterium]